MEDDGPGVWPFGGPSADDGYCDFVLDDDDDLCIDIETLNRILDEHPETAEGSRGDSSRIDSSAESGKLKNSLSQSGSQVTDWAPSRDDLSCSLKASDTGTGIHSCSFNGQGKVELGQSSSPAYTSSASLNDWFSLSHGGQCVEHFGVSPSEMTSFSTVSSSMDRDTAYFSNHGGNVVFNPVNCEARTVSKCESDKNDSKFVAFRPYEVNPYLNGVPEYGSGTTGTSERSTFYHNSNFQSDDAGVHVFSPLYCHNTSDASSAEASNNAPQNFAFQLFPDETMNDAANIVSECPSDGVCLSRMIFDRHGRLTGGSTESEPVLDALSARGLNFKSEVSPPVSLAYDESYKSFDSHLGDKELTHPHIINWSSSSVKNEVVHLEGEPDNDSVGLDSLMYGPDLGKDGLQDEAFAAGGSRWCLSGVSGCMPSFQTNVEREYSITASEAASVSLDLGSRSSSKFLDSNVSLQYTRSLDPVKPSFELDFPRDERENEEIQSRSMDINLSKVSPESIQSSSPEYRSCIDDDDSDVYIIEASGRLVRPQSLVVQKAAFSSENSVVSQSYHSECVKLRSNDEQRIFQAALRDLSQPKSEATLPDGVLAVPLLRHQRIALSWMVQKEKSGFPCSGGILADDQGLGKTVSTIALILKERPVLSRTCQEGIHKEIFDIEDEDGEDAASKPDKEGQESEQCQLSSDEGKGSRHVFGKTKGRPAAGTLIVCPTSVLRQWTNELRNKVSCESNFSVRVYYGPNRTKDPHELAKYDVVLTTYSIVSMEVPKQPLVDVDDEEKGNSDGGGFPSVGFGSNKKRKYPPSSHKKASKQRKGGDRASVETLSGPLAKVSWFRVVLDEAQSIKNHRTQVAKACWGLRSKRRWCLSGTPIQNAIDDLYSYFRFLRYEPFSVYTSFCSIIKNPISMNPMKGYQKLQAVLQTVMLRRTKGTLLDGKPIISLPPKSIELRKVDFTKEERDFYSTLECRSRDQFREYAEAGTVKQNYVNILLMLLRLRQACDHPLLVQGYEFSSAGKSSVETVKKLPNEKQVFLLNCLEASLAICGICSDAPEDAVVSICGHVFCKQCICEHLTGDDNQCPIANCKVGLTLSSLFSKATLDKMHGLDAPVDCSGSDSIGAVEPCPENPPYNSSKIKAALDVLQSLARPQSLALTDDLNQTSHNGDAQHPKKLSILPDAAVKNVGNNLDCPRKLVGEKAIVFSQWTKMLDILEACLQNSCIQYRRLDGTMSVVARDKAVKDFNTLPEVSVMIMSLKAASLGLNMVAACHVLLLDLWWNPTTEDQAIDRAHRIGQTRPVSVVRLTVKDTVEDRILALQQKKRTMVASAFGEDEKGSRQTRLTVDDLKYLFRV